MRCRPGDLAVIVRVNKLEENLGKIVRVVGKTRNRTDSWLCAIAGGARAQNNLTGRVEVITHASIPDYCLRPIRDNDGEDETLQWAPVPSSKEVV